MADNHFQILGAGVDNSVLWLSFAQQKLLSTTTRHKGKHEIIKSTLVGKENVLSSKTLGTCNANIQNEPTNRCTSLIELFR
jgi:hypothetical protein